MECAYSYGGRPCCWASRPPRRAGVRPPSSRGPPLGRPRAPAGGGGPPPAPAPPPPPPVLGPVVTQTRSDITLCRRRGGPRTRRGPVGAGDPRTPPLLPPPASPAQQ